jgi:hypothetical protein
MMECSDQLSLSSCIIDQKPEIELLNEYWPHLQALNSSQELWIIALQCTKELHKRPRESEETKWLVVPLLLHPWSKTRNWNTQRILATLTVKVAQ